MQSTKKKSRLNVSTAKTESHEKDTEPVSFSRVSQSTRTFSSPQVTRYSVDLRPSRMLLIRSATLWRNLFILPRRSERAFVSWRQIIPARARFPDGSELVASKLPQADPENRRVM